MAKKTKAEETREKIVKAIENKQRLIINYEGKGERLIDPYLYGQAEKKEDANYLLRAWQVGGHTEKTRENENPAVDSWKLFDVDKITEIREADSNDVKLILGKGGKTTFNKRNSFNTKSDEAISYEIKRFR